MQQNSLPKESDNHMWSTNPRRLAARHRRLPLCLLFRGSVFVLVSDTKSIIRGDVLNHGRSYFEILKSSRGALRDFLSDSRTACGTFGEHKMGTAKGPKPCFWLSKRSQKGVKSRSRSVPAANGPQAGFGGPPGPQSIIKNRPLEPFWNQNESQHRGVP